MEPFISTDDLAAYVRRDLSNELLMAEWATGSACETLRDALGQQIDGVIDDVEVLSSEGTDALLLPELPVLNVREVAIRGTTDDLNVVVPASSYWVDQRNGMIKTRFMGGHWIKGNGVYQVTYSHGWGNPLVSGDSGGYTADAFEIVFPDIPRSLRIIALTLAARILDQGLVKGETVGMYQSIYASDESLGLTKGELNMLAKLRPGRLTH